MSPSPQTETFWTRRQMLARSAAAATALAALPLTAAEPVRKLVPGGRVWDCHTHLSGSEGTPEERIRFLLKHADRLGIDKLIVFMGVHWVQDPTPQQCRSQNDDVLRALAVAPDRVFGFVYLNPAYVDESLQELDRCVRDGPMLGVKLWVALKCNDPRLDPLCEHCKELECVLLQHAYRRTGPNLPQESAPLEVAELARRHPTLPIIAAHTGNDWEHGIRAIRATPNVMCELSGFDPTAGVTEMAIRELGAERIVYGSDAGGRSFASQMSKALSADLPDAAQRLIFGGNIERILTPILKRKGIRL